MSSTPINFLFRLSHNNSVRSFQQCPRSVVKTSNAIMSCDHNAIFYPGVPSRSSGGRKCQTDDNGIFADQYYHGNTCLEHGGAYYSFNKCSKGNVGSTTYQTANNTFLADLKAGEAFGAPCGAKDLHEWQSWGQDSGSQIVQTPDVEGLLAIAKEKLGGKELMN